MLKINNLSKNYLEFLEKINTEDYEDMMKKLSSRSNIEKTHAFLEFLFRIRGMEFKPSYPRIYLTSHLIANFNNDLNIPKNSEIYNYSCYLSRLNRQSWRGFCEIFISYINIFNEWKLEDKRRMLRVLAESYYNLDTTLKKIV